MTIQTIKKVIAYGLDSDFESGSIEKQIAMSLKVYADRKEFDGSLESAIECLELAGYEVDDWSDMGGSHAEILETFDTALNILSKDLK